ncbi:hypothetical protein GWC95_03850 [Sediminibacterium roseum]|uniref:CDP-Glycerol:Poly(Glycerophosphate) glycerophosphotransferase n=1 Tax=Sediminibacterium roseum TaxID=1978412 RepID=A0ABW9ZVZ1_9BACT|nr:hypothetical protein [Sediminibacterium roseum]NCI49041.1 hypothetical protein [Sediminibacterium roseum]
MKRPLSLTQSQFQYIVEQSEAILEKHASDFSIVGNAWLNVLHSHPSIQERYVRVFHKRTVPELITDVLRGAVNILAGLIRSLTMIFKTPGLSKIKPQTDVLFISHLLNASTPKHAPDFYFQELPDYLQSQGYHVAVGLMNHVPAFKGWVDDETASAQPEKFVLPLQLAPVAELKIISRALRTAFFFFRQYLEEKDPLRKSFLRELSGNTLSPHTLRAYRLYETLVPVIRQTNIKTIAFTYEGHSWERMACHAAKTAPRKIMAIGYQHTILFPSSHSIKKSRGAAYDPDLILTVGGVTRGILMASGELRNTAILEYGSPRLKREPVYTPVGETVNACLVTPEGLVNECMALFGFAVKAAIAMPETSFIFRTHPTIRFTDLQEEEPLLRELPPNIILSTNKNIDDDFKRSSWLLYRNSSVAFFAVLSGLRPLYLQIGAEISDDVLYALKSWRKTVTDLSDLEKIFAQDAHTSSEERTAEREEAFAFCRKYMIPYDVKVFEQFIKEGAMHA